MIHQSLTLARVSQAATTDTPSVSQSAQDGPPGSAVAAMEPTAIVLAGLADRNANLFRRLGLPLGDPAACLEFIQPGQRRGETLGIVRDLEMDRARAHTILDEIACPADFPPSVGEASGDRETAVAQAVAEAIRRQGMSRVRVDRTLPAIFVWHLAAAGMTIDYDDQLGVSDRRAKSDDEIAALKQAQHVTEQVMLSVLRMIATADVNDEGMLLQDGHVLTSERVRVQAARLFMDRGFTMTHGAIVATSPDSADCHHAGSGPLKTGVPIIVDLFPRDDSSRYHGDCTRTVVHGQPSEMVQRMHAAVQQAKTLAEDLLCPGNTAEAVHQAAEEELKRAGFEIKRGTITEEPSIQHGTGHGIGLEIHEPILLDHGAGEMLCGEVFTVEPGLYGQRDGGVRIEDMLVVTASGPKNLNELPTGLDWTWSD